MAKKPAKKSAAKSAHRENLVERIAEEVEARFLEGAEMATETTSAETNIALAALAAIEGLREPKAKAEAKPSHGKRKSPAVRSKKR